MWNRGFFFRHKKPAEMNWRPGKEGNFTGVIQVRTNGYTGLSWTGRKKENAVALQDHSPNPDFEAYCFENFATIPATVALSV